MCSGWVAFIFDTEKLVTALEFEGIASPTEYVTTVRVAKLMEGQTAKFEVIPGMESLRTGVSLTNIKNKVSVGPLRAKGLEITFLAHVGYETSSFGIYACSYGCGTSPTLNAGADSQPFR